MISEFRSSLWNRETLNQRVIKWDENKSIQPNFKQKKPMTFWSRAFQQQLLFVDNKTVVLKLDVNPEMI